LQRQKLRFLSRYLEGNATELRGRISGNEIRLNDHDQSVATLQRMLDDVNQEVQQQSAADLIRHNDLDSRLVRDEKRIHYLENASAENSDVLVTLSHSILQESNSRQVALDGFSNEMQSLRTAITELETQTSNSKQALLLHSQQLTEISGSQSLTQGNGFAQKLFSFPIMCTNLLVSSEIGQK